MEQELGNELEDVALNAREALWDPGSILLVIIHWEGCQSTPCDFAARQYELLVRAFLILQVEPRTLHMPRTLYFWGVVGQLLSCPTLCHPDYSTSDSSVLHCLPELAQIHVHGVSDAIQHLILWCPLSILPSVFPSIRVFSSELFLRIRWPKYSTSASTSVLPMNIQNWFPLGWTEDDGLYRVPPKFVMLKP